MADDARPGFKFLPTQKDGRTELIEPEEFGTVYDATFDPWRAESRDEAKMDPEPEVSDPGPVVDAFDFLM